MLLNKRISIWVFIKHIRFDIIAILSFAVLVGFLDNYRVFSKIVIPLSIAAIVGTALSLLLAFRTAQSYERWWEARIIWGSIVNDSRTLVRQLQLYAATAKKEEQKEFATRQIIWCYALSASLRKEPFPENVQAYLQEHRLADANIPNAILNEHNRQLEHLFRNSNLSDFGRMQIDNTLTRLCEAMGKCERIKNTVFPRSYSLLIHLLIYVFAATLPFGLDDNYLLVEIFLTAGLPVFFIAIEKTAILMQDPFENTPMDTPMTTLSITIEINLKQMIGDKNLPVVEKPATYYSM